MPLHCIAHLSVAILIDLLHHVLHHFHSGGDQGDSLFIHVREGLQHLVLCQEPVVVNVNEFECFLGHLFPLLDAVLEGLLLVFYYRHLVDSPDAHLRIVRRIC